MTCYRAPLCEQALATNRELRERNADLEKRLLASLPDGRARQDRLDLLAAESELRALRARPFVRWALLPWRGFVS